MSTRRVLFVDDDPNSIDGLRRMLRKYRDKWEMEFANCGAEALERMSKSPFDVLVTDIHMPGIGGADLLEQVGRHYPQTARIILSGHADEATATRVISLAHRYLAKPASPETLIDTLAQAVRIRESMPDDKVGGWIANCNPLPTPPQIYVELTRAMASDTGDVRTVARIIARDISLSAKLLQLVNSSFFGVARRVSSVEHAISLLGMLRIKGMVLSEHIFRQFSPPPSCRAIVDALWRHSYAVAEIASGISKLEGQKDDRPDQAFTAGLLHDIGTLVVMAKASASFDSFLAAREGCAAPVPQLEQELLGATHGEIGAQLLALWGLPPRIVEAVQLHHAPSQTSYGGLCAITCVHVADVLANEFAGTNENAAVADIMLDRDYLERIGLHKRYEAWQQLALKVSERAREQEAIAT
jgi:HD-like signal output (HDOD) protein/CheY-like chemotaxis protein